MAPHPRFQTMSVNLPVDLISRVRVLAFHEEFSASAIVEQALLAFLAGLSDEELASRLRASGAALRRA